MTTKRKKKHIRRRGIEGSAVSKPAAAQTSGVMPIQSSTSKGLLEFRERFKEYVRYHITPNTKYPDARLSMKLDEVMDYFDTAYEITHPLTPPRKKR